MYTIYFNPSDFPGKFVLRAYHIGRGTVEADDKFKLGDSANEVRQHVPKGLVNIGRNADDDPVILEVWI